MSYETLPKGRLEAFSDGVLAIVVTILVLELKVPEAHNNSSLLTELLHSWRNYVGYLVSFAFVGGFWVAHSNATRLISKGDPVLFRLNLVFLFFVSLLPFTTAMMTDYLGHPGQEAAVAIYGLNLFLGSVMLTLVINYPANRKHLVDEEIADEELDANEKQRRVLLVFQGVAVLIALLLPNLAIGLYLLAAMLFLIAPLLSARSGRSARDRPTKT